MKKTKKPGSKPSRQICRKCGMTEGPHLRGEVTHAYDPQQAPAGVHRTPRVAIFVPDPAGNKARWEAAAKADDLTLGDLVGVLLEAHARRKGR